MRVAWVHSFDPAVLNSGVFMHILAKEVRRKGVEVELVGIKDIISPRNLLNIGRQISSRVADYDLVHVQYGSGCGYFTSRITQKKILSLRGSDWYGHNEFDIRGRVHSYVSKLMTRISMRSYDRVIVMSERMKSEISAAGLMKDEARVLPSGIDLSAFRPLDRSTAREQLGESGDNAPWVLFSTIIDNNPLKRVELARAAFNLIKETMPDAKFKLLHGVPHENVPLMINASNVILLTSTHEGLPNIIKEGLACNIPFVATDVSDLAMIAKKEYSCRITRPDPAELAAGIIDVIRQGCVGGLSRAIA